MRKKLTKEDINYFKKILLKQKERILEKIKNISEETLKKSQKDASGDISGYTFHMADVATDTYDREFSLQIADDERQLLYELDEALIKIEKGNYGICESCKAPISKVRLRALPYARLCIKCQQAKEKT
ncbi:MAG: TraR/DksA family transcriptional regulator [Candidatus Omnitrophica bacterium]|nr:TraR/DksA family transcriptional regulator [Candidatus Omnitrophota bacterium]MCM8799365.1 TraR/DksA family transcriptional regulator [Candidatus Omnitrophota bacterium]